MTQQVGITLLAGPMAGVMRINKTATIISKKAATEIKAFGREIIGIGKSFPPPFAQASLYLPGHLKS